MTKIEPYARNREPAGFRDGGGCLETDPGARIGVLMQVKQECRLQTLGCSARCVQLT